MAQITIEDVIIEGTKKGTLNPISPLTAEQTIGMLANLAKDVNQAPDVITALGLGTYGLSKLNLETAGIMKRGLAASNNPADLAVVLSDPSVFTGLMGVTESKVLKKNEGLQRAILVDAIESVISLMKLQGLITESTSLNDFVVYASLAARYDLTTIRGWINGTVVSSEMDTVKAGALYALNLVDTKAASALASVVGIGSAVGVPVKATSTVKTADVDAAVDKLVGSKRIASTVDPGELEANNSKADGMLTRGDLF